MNNLNQETHNHYKSCRICGSEEMTFFKPSNINKKMDSSLFAITDNAYGVTGELWKCRKCGFIQAVDLEQPELFYEKMEDPVYISQADCRRIQARIFLQKAIGEKKPGKLLDIGAGCGFLVKEALDAGWDATGIEPCGYLQKEAERNNIPVLQGVFPDPERVAGLFDVITLTDVIEHVPDPVSLLQNAAKALAPNGVIFLTTPDSSSLPARLLGKKWWHYRIAHIGYFNKNNLFLALSKAGLMPLKTGRPSWYFGLDYLIERPIGYLPFKLPKSRLGAWLSKITIPLNLRDSFYVRTCKSEEKPHEE